jgi:undecaprenyl-diphosphatase
MPFDLIKMFDYFVLHYLNVDLGNPVLDQFWLTITQLHKFAVVQYGVFPLVLAALAYIYRARSIKILVALALALGLADAFSYRVVKHIVDRPRPFQNSEISSWLRKVGEAHGPSFPSNHAANSFAAASVLTWYFPGVGYLFYIFAGLIALSRIALGVHYPTDVIAGAGLGIFVGFLLKICLLNRVRWFFMRAPVSKADSESYSWRTRSRRLE